MTKMNFVYYCADDMLNGTMTMTVEEELAYRRIVDLIYSTNNKLEDNNRMGWMTKLGENWEKVRQSLIEKNKIMIEKGFITVERCTDEINKAKLNYEKKQKAAKIRWGNASADAGADSNAYANHKPLTTNHKLNNHKLIFEEEFWKHINYKKGKEGAWKSFKRIDFEKENLKPKDLADKYNEYLDNLPDYQDTPKWVQGWLADRRWEDEDTLTGPAFAKKHNITGQFLKYENGLYYFREKERWGVYVNKYDKKGKYVLDGETRKTKKETPIQG